MRRLRRRAALGLTLLLTLSACARDPVLVDGEWHSERAGFRIGVPAAAVGNPDDPDPPAQWERFDLDGALLAYRRDARETLSLQARCGRPVAEPAIMARQLLIGIPERTLREGGPREIAGRSGWLQTFDARLDGRMVRIKTMTLVSGGCAYDLVLVAEGDSEPAERVFDAWVDTFALTRGDVAEGTP